MHENDEMDDLKAHYTGIGLVFGLSFGAVFGVLFTVLLDRPGMIGVGVGSGVAIGFAIGEGLYKYYKDR